MAYTLTEYGAMILDRGRMQPYVEALRQSIFPGCVVADLGAATGIFSLLACQFGAARVYAIDPDTSILAARECAAANGYADRITCFQAMSHEVVLPERVDVVVSDMRGALPMMGRHFMAIADARARFLKPGGRLIPQSDTIRCAPVEIPETYRAIEEPWTRNDFGLDLTSVRQYVLKSWDHQQFEAMHLLAAPEDWVRIDYATIDSPNLDGWSRWTIERDGTLHGLGIWFDAQLTDTFGYSNAPGQPDLVYGRCMVPLERAVQVAVGDRVEVHLRAHCLRGEYLYRWDTAVTGVDGTRKAEFHQSTVGSAPAELASLHKRADSHIAQLGDQGQIDRFVLDRMDGRASLREISQALMESFPSRFADWHRALDVVSELSARYSK